MQRWVSDSLSTGQLATPLSYGGAVSNSGLSRSRKSAVWTGLLSGLGSLALAMLLVGLPVWSALSNDAAAGYRAPLTAAVAILLQGVLFIGRRPGLPFHLAMGLLVLVLEVAAFASALAHGQNTEYGTWKLQGFLIFAVAPCLILAFNYAGDLKRVRHLLIALFLVSLISVAALAAAHPVLLNPSRTVEEIYLIGANPIPVSRSVGMCALMLVAFASIQRSWCRYFTLAAGIACMFAQLVIGERGPVLAVLVSVVFVPSSIRARLTLVGLFLLLIIRVLAGGVQHPNQKFSLEAVKGDGRVGIMAEGMERFLEEPLMGVGLGTFYSPDGTRDYFHNLEGELATETGLIGLATFFAYLVVVIPWRSSTLSGIRVRRMSRTPERLFSCVLTIFWLAAAQVSGDIVSNGMCWVAAMLWGCTALATGTRVSSGELDS